jgi:glycosyltransferase involved in cell wall biosynthesis
MIKNRDIIVLGLQAWDIEIGSNCKNIALEFSRNNRVLYVNAPLDFNTAISKRNDPRIKKRKEIIKGKQDDLVELQENLWNLNPRTYLYSINQIGNKALFNFLNRINNKRYASRIIEAAKRLNFKDIIVFNDSDMFRSFYLKEQLKPKTYIYYTRDNLIAVDYWKKQGIRIEAKHMAKADFVCANSTYLAKLASEFNPHSYYVGQGCDVSAFDTQLVDYVPKDIKDIPKPIVGYIGALLALRLDIDVLVKIAKDKPEWSLVLVGPEDDHFKQSELHHLKNVYFLGNKDGKELPAYLNAFDVALNPQKLNPVTIGNYPRKIDEYLAMGKPTVATKTEAMSVFADHTYLANNGQEYIQYIAQALDENSKEKELARSVFARDHSWENNVKAIYELVEKFENGKLK